MQFVPTSLTLIYSILSSEKSGIWNPNILLNILFSKLICAEVSKMTVASKQVFHQTVNAQNSMLTRQIHDQGKNYFLNWILRFQPTRAIVGPSQSVQWFDILSTCFWENEKRKLEYHTISRRPKNIWIVQNFIND